MKALVLGLAVVLLAGAGSRADEPMVEAFDLVNVDGRLCIRAPQPGKIEKGAKIMPIPERTVLNITEAGSLTMTVSRAGDFTFEATPDGGVQYHQTGFRPDGTPGEQTMHATYFRMTFRSDLAP